MKNLFKRCVIAFDAFFCERNIVIMLAVIAACVCMWVDPLLLPVICGLTLIGAVAGVICMLAFAYVALQYIKLVKWARSNSK